MNSHESPPRYDSDNSDDNSQNSSSTSCRIKSNEEIELSHNAQDIGHRTVDTPREKDKLRIKELESEISVLQVFLFTFQTYAITS